MDSSQEEKQIFLRQNILDKGYDTNLFVEFLIGKNGEGGADVGNWTMVDLKKVVKEFIARQENTEKVYFSGGSAPRVLHPADRAGENGTADRRHDLRRRPHGRSRVAGSLRRAVADRRYPRHP